VPFQSGICSCMLLLKLSLKIFISCTSLVLGSMSLCINWSDIVYDILI
jgi:hypothetical protein